MGERWCLVSKITPHDVSLTSLMDVTLDDHSDKQSVTKVSEKTFFCHRNCFPRPLKRGRSMFQISILLSYRNCCPNQAKGSCHLRRPRCSGKMTPYAPSQIRNYFRFYQGCLAFEFSSMRLSKTGSLVRALAAVKSRLG